MKKILLSASGTAALAASLALVVAPPAHAQETTATPGVAASASNDESIVVYARKRAEQLQDVPVSVTAFSADDLAQQHATDLLALQGVPNLFVQDFGLFPGSGSFTIRGITTGAALETSFEQAVAVNVNGVANNRANGSIADFYDIESLSILRGPQGTLFGKNTTAGVVDIRTRRPSGDFGYNAALTIGDFGLHEVEAGVDLPLVEDRLALRLALKTTAREGYYANCTAVGACNNEDVASVDHLSYRGTLQFTPDPSLTWTVFASQDRYRDGTGSQFRRDRPGFVFYSLLGTDNIGGFGNSDYLTNNGVTATNGPFQNDFDRFAITNEIVKDFSGVSLTSVTGYQTTESATDVDADGSPIVGLQVHLDEDFSQFSQELRLNNVEDARFNWVAGVFYSMAEYTNNDVQALDANLLGLGPFVPGTVVIPLAGRDHQEATSYAVFAEVDYDVTDRLTVSVGGRYTWETKEFETSPNGTLPATSGVRSDNWDFFTPHVGANYRVNDDFLLFANWSRGTKSGGFNGRASSFSTVGPYAPETVDSYEVGFKADWFDGQLRTNFTVFDAIYSDKQFPVNRLSPPGSPVPFELVIANDANIETRGFEAEITWLPTDQLTLNLDVGYTDAFYTEFFADLAGTGTPIDNSNQEVVFVADWNGRLHGAYEVPLGNGSSLTFDAAYNYRSDMEADAINDPANHIESLGTVDLGLRWDSGEHPYSVLLWARNVTDEQQYVVTFNNGPIGSIGFLNPPATVGLTLTIHD